MILLDANILLYATDYPQHETIRLWLEKQINSGEYIGMAWITLLAFIRISTNSRIFAQPLPIQEAWQQIEEWLVLPCVWIPQPADKHSLILRELLFAVNATGNLIPDAHLAALALEHNLLLCSTDRDFTKFKKLNWLNPMDNTYQ